MRGTRPSGNRVVSGYTVPLEYLPPAQLILLVRIGREDEDKERERDNEWRVAKEIGEG
jgi:hypothetical protein